GRLRGIGLDRARGAWQRGTEEEGILEPFPGARRHHAERGSDRAAVWRPALHLVIRLDLDRLAELLSHPRGAKIAGDRVEPAEGNHAGSACRRAVVVTVDERPHP